jgi:AcrR family transcriptional regulator
MTTSPRPNRGPAAAAENRAAIIQAASEIFAEQGFDAPMNAIAKRAGVGQGSLYRHFPTRNHLAVVAFEQNLGEIEAVANSGGSLADVLRIVSAQATASVAFIELVQQVAHDPQASGLETRLRAIVTSTIESGRAAGTIPVGFSIDDVLLAIRLVAGGLAGTLPEERPALLAASWHLVGIQLD